jgi:hypothetical protein
MDSQKLLWRINIFTIMCPNLMSSNTYIKGPFFLCCWQVIPFRKKPKEKSTFVNFVSNFCKQATLIFAKMRERKVSFQPYFAANILKMFIKILVYEKHVDLQTHTNGRLKKRWIFILKKNSIRSINQEDMQRRCAAFTLSTRNETVKPRKAVRNFDFVMFSEHVASK